MNKKVCNIILTVLFINVFFFSCTKDDTINNNPITDSFVRDDYVASWDGTEVPAVKNQTFICNISANPNVSSNIFMYKFANIAGAAYAIVSGSNVTIPRQTINGNTIEGYGKMQNKSYITWHYYVNDGSDSIVYNTTFNKRP